MKNNKELYVLIELQSNIAFYAIDLKPIADHCNVSTNTIRRWINKPSLAAKKGYIVAIASKLTSLRGGTRINSPIGK